jgi:hypothetical protein
METKQTAVDWLVSKVNKQSWGDFRIDIPKEIIEQAQAMHEQQIIDAHDNGKNILPPNENGKQYYTETYNQPKP